MNLIFIFFLLFIISTINSYDYFQAYPLISGNLILITDDHVIHQNKNTDELYYIYSIDNDLTDEQFLNAISFAQFSSNDGEHIICRFKDCIVILYEEKSKKAVIQNQKLKNYYCKIIPNKIINNHLIFAITYINSFYKLNLIVYDADINNHYSYTLAIEKELENNTYMQDSISCDYMYSNKNINNNVLLCFLYELNTNNFVTISFDPDNNYQEEVLSRTGKFYGISVIKSVVSPDKKKNLVCFIDYYNSYKCALYNIEKNSWSDENTLLYDCPINNYENNLFYINDKSEYLVYTYSEVTILNIFIFDEHFRIKTHNEQGQNCYTIDYISNCDRKLSSSLYYSKQSSNYTLMVKCQNSGTNVDYTLNIEIECSSQNFIFEDFEEYIPIATTLLVQTTIPKTTPLTTIPSINSFTSIPSTNYLTTIPTTTSLTTNPITNYLSTTIPTIVSLSTIPITNSFTTIPSKKYLSTIPSILSSLPSSTEFPQNLPYSIISNTLSLTSSTISSIVLNYILIYDEGDIISGKINITKKELEKRLNEIVKLIKVNQKYKINGDDYNITISPINDINSFNSTYIDFSECEKILRKEYHLSPEEILTILQIEIDKMDEKSLINQIEYAIYNEKKEQLNLDYCKDIEIKINYEIKDESLLNKSMISYFSDLGIDIFNINDSFFNDICYPYSNSFSDLVLNDRKSDIYQNYSLCDNNCEYDGIDLQNKSITCSCKIKTEIDTDIKPPEFAVIVEDTFIYSNFGVIKCYNLVFSLKNKKNNFGFLTFLILIIIHFPLYIYYFINRIKGIKVFVYREMEKNNYIAKIMIPPMRNKKINHSNNDKKINISSKNTLSRTEKKKQANDYNSIVYQNDNSNSKSLILNNNLKSNKINLKKNKINKTKIRKSITPIFLENEKFPGYYHLIQMNADNTTNRIPPESKYILDNYDYDTAIKYENRSFCRIFYICLLSKENILNTFFFKSYLEVQSLRLTSFIFSYSCDLALNALFYLNKKISDKYHYEGNYQLFFTIINNITISVSSTIFSFLLVKSLEFLTNSKDDIEKLFRIEEQKMRRDKDFIVSLKTKRNIHIELIKIFKLLNIKIIIYIIIELIIMLFFFYYITSFCEVYKDTQMSWALDSFISFLLSILTELFTSFLTTVLYLISLKYQLRILYKFVIFFYGIG